MTNSAIIKKIKEINQALRKDYPDTETPEKPRSREFNRKFTSLLKGVLGEGYEIIPTKGTWCEASGFIKHNDKFVYYSTNDYRWNFMGAWFERILIRTAESEKDYKGGSNHFSDLINTYTYESKFKDDVDLLFR